MYPRTYRLNLVWRGSMLALGAALALGGGVCLDLFADNGLLVAGALLAMLLGIVLVADTLVSKVVLHEDAIEVSGLRPARRLHRTMIAGIRVEPGYDDTGTSTLVLVPLAAGDKPIRLSTALRTDATFDAWLDGLPRLDAKRR